MGDLNTPPPSYAEAISIPTPSINPYFPSVPSSTTKSAHLSIEEILSAPVRPLLPRPTTSAATSQRAHSATSKWNYRNQNRPIPTSHQTTILEQQQQQQPSGTNKKGPGLCIFIIFFALGFFIFIVVMIARVRGTVRSYKHNG